MTVLTEASGNLPTIQPQDSNGSGTRSLPTIQWQDGDISDRILRILFTILRQDHDSSDRRTSSLPYFQWQNNDRSNIISTRNSK